MTKITPTIQWLLENDDPGVRYLTLRDLVGESPKSHELLAAKKEAYERGPIAEVLKHMDSEGYWVKPGPGYNPKYKSTVWSLILLSQLGASVEDDPRIQKACEYYLNHAFSSAYSISLNGTPSGSIYCLQGNMTLALTLLGYVDARLAQTYDWMARSVIGDGVRYYAYTCGPNFACGANGKKPCAWGAVKVLLALGAVSENKRTPAMKKAIKAGAEFFFDVDPITAKYPTRTNTPPSRDWWKFGFPVFYISDILQIAETLASAGYGKDPRLQHTIEYIKSKQDEQGRWPLEYHYTGKTWGNYGERGKPNKWVTYRALKLLKKL